MRKIFQKFTSNKVNLVMPVLIVYISKKTGLNLPKGIQAWSSSLATNTYASSKMISEGLHSLEKNQPLENLIEENKRFFSRHLPPDENKIYSDKDIEELADLFCRHENQFNEGRSNLFFAYFAQWFTDGFFRSSLIDPRQTGSNHDVDLCQIYGLDKTTTQALRSDSNGHLKFQGNKGEEISPTLFRETKDGFKIKEEFADISYLRDLKKSLTTSNTSSNASNEFELIIERLTGARTKGELDFAINKVSATTLATGLERGNATLGNLSLNTLFLRSHNRICDDLCQLAEFSGIQDPVQKNDRVFQRAREINTVLLIKLTIEEYINHIAGRKLFKFDPECAYGKSWNKQPWLAAEFNLLYRWHGLVPNQVKLANQTFVGHREAPFNTISDHGLSTILKSACEQAAGKIQAGNTPPFLRNAEKKLITLGRDWQLQTYNEYRKAFSLKPLKSISQLTSSERLRAKLQEIYGHINNVEFVVGLYAEDSYNTQLVGELQSKMVAYDAFTFLYSNPLLEKNNYQKLLTNQVAKQWLEKINSLDEFVAKVSSSQPSGEFHFDNPSMQDKPKIKPIKKTDNIRDVYENTLCPHLRIGLRTGDLTPNESGWTDIGQFHSFFERVGIKHNSLLAKVLLHAGQDCSPFNLKKMIKVSAFKNSYLDHGSSTGILNSDKKLDSSRINIFKHNAITLQNSDELRLYKKQFEIIADELHEKPKEFKAGFRGQLLQLCEFRIVNEVYGRWDTTLKQKYLTYDDIVSIWKYARPPKGWQYARQPSIGITWSLKTLSACLWHLLKRKVSSNFNKGRT